MDPKVLRNPTNRTFEFMYDGRVIVFNPGETRAIEGDAAALALEMNNTPLVDTIDSGPDYASLTLPKLLKLAKERGIKTRFGMKKIEVIGLLLNE